MVTHIKYIDFTSFPSFTSCRIKMAKMSAEQIDANATCAKVLKRKSRNERKLFLLFHSLLRTVPTQLVMQIFLP